MDIEGKKIVVTGAASGIGRALARRFQAEGAAQIVLTDVNQNGLDEVAREIGADAKVANMGDERDVVNFIQYAEERLGQIDLLCNNAGISVAEGQRLARRLAKYLASECDGTCMGNSSRLARNARSRRRLSITYRFCGRLA